MAFNRAGHSPALQASRLVEGPGQKPAGQSLLKAGKVFRLSPRDVLAGLRGFRKPKTLKCSRACACSATARMGSCEGGPSV